MGRTQGIVQTCGEPHGNRSAERQRSRSDRHGIEKAGLEQGAGGVIDPGRSAARSMQVPVAGVSLYSAKPVRTKIPEPLFCEAVITIVMLNDAAAHPPNVRAILVPRAATYLPGPYE